MKAAKWLIFLFESMQRRDEHSKTTSDTVGTQSQSKYTRRLFCFEYSFITMLLISLRMVCMHLLTVFWLITGMIIMIASAFF